MSKHLLICLTALAVLCLLPCTFLQAQSATSWETNGNASVPSNSFIGTTDPTPVCVKTDNIERMTVGADGKVTLKSLVGIGHAIVAVDDQGQLQRLGDPGLDSLWDCSTKLYRATGNYLTPTCFIGSTNPAPFRLVTNNAERMRISESGQVGIGTVSPLAPLHVYGQAGGTLFRLEGGNPFAQNQLAFWSGPFGNIPQAQLAGVAAQFNSNTGRAELRLVVNNGSSATNAVPVYRADHTRTEISTKLGVGTAAHAQDQLFVNGAVRVSQNGTPGNHLRLGHNGTNAFLEQVSIGNSNANSKLLINANGNKTEFGGTVLMNQNLGIGTVNFVDGANTYRLAVNGKVRAKEVRVYSAWADYVFQEGYALMPLSEVEQFVKDNGHLPGIPSAVEVESKGLELGAMQAKMMEKIEELTLHLIRLEKENALLKQEVKGLKR